MPLEQFRNSKNSQKKDKRIDTVRGGKLQRRLSMKVLLASGKSKAASCGETTPVGMKTKRRGGHVGSFRRLALLEHKPGEINTPFGTSLAAAGPASACMETDHVPKTAKKLCDNLLNRSIVGQMTAV